MKYFQIIYTILFFTICSSQEIDEENLIGKWIVEKTIKKDGVCLITFNPNDNTKVINWEDTIFEFTENNQLYLYPNKELGFKKSEIHLSWEFISPNKIELYNHNKENILSIFISNKEDTVFFDIFVNYKLSMKKI